MGKQKGNSAGTEGTVCIWEWVIREDEEGLKKLGEAPPNILCGKFSSHAAEAGMV